MNKFSNTWSLMRASLDVLGKDKELLLFPLISGICCILVMVSFIIPIGTINHWNLADSSNYKGSEGIYIAVLFLFYFCNYAVIIFFNSAVVACATKRMRGGDPTLSDGLRAAFENLPLILGWALVSASVGLVLRMIESSRHDTVGRIVAGLLGMAWTVISFLVIPIMINEKKNPISALKESTSLLKKTWGEQLIGNFSFELVFLVLSIPAIILLLLGLMIGGGVAMFLLIALAVLYLIALGLIHSVLQSIYQTAVYLYAREHRVPEGFEADMLHNAMVRNQSNTL